VALYEGGVDQYDPEEWRSVYRDTEPLTGKRFELGPDCTVFMDTYAMQAAGGGLRRRACAAERHWLLWFRFGFLAYCLTCLPKDSRIRRFATGDAGVYGLTR
jgi:hypothetical protein